MIYLYIVSNVVGPDCHNLLCPHYKDDIFVGACDFIIRIEYLFIGSLLANLSLLVLLLRNHKLIKYS
ncbi:hypothetical protein NARC_100130 [Candidatus Nitrosocosmicus arcticus]|uniref:Uncharacterized protein n=1 Tax=Candidatus Nitrosocosmicus arcticus TaxID=2035267 RepID=A0A557SU04_9ARCH|nr:hypothetical protein NARC_100130 [Candidatus Nitrosocosmicus arcticus]